MHALLLSLALLGTSSEAIHTAAGCPSVFGDGATRAINRRHRQEVLVSVAAGPSAVDVVHSATYRRPVSASMEGLTLLATTKQKDGSWRARVSLSAALAAGCEVGTYDVEVDDDIGSARVLAILESAVLLEDSQGRLDYLYVPGKTRPVFRLTWASPWLLFQQGTPGGAPGGNAPPKTVPAPGYPGPTGPR